MSDADTLQGVKAIVAYLRGKGYSFSGRSILREAKSGAFPLRHRTHHGPKPRAFAMSSEVDAWLLGVPPPTAAASGDILRA